MTIKDQKQNKKKLRGWKHSI